MPVDIVFGVHHNTINIQQFVQMIARCRIVNEYYSISLKQCNDKKETNYNVLKNKLIEEIKIITNLCGKYNRLVGTDRVKQIIWEENKEYYEFAINNNITLGKLYNLSFNEKLNYISEKLDTIVNDITVWQDSKIVKTKDEALSKELSIISKEIKEDEFNSIKNANVLKKEDLEYVSSKEEISDEEMFDIKKTNISMLLGLDELTDDDIKFAMNQRNIKKLKTLEIINMSDDDVAYIKYNKLSRQELFSNEYSIRNCSLFLKNYGFQFKMSDDIILPLDNVKIMLNDIIKNKQLFVNAGLLDKRALSIKPEDIDNIVVIKSSLSQLFAKFGYSLKIIDDNMIFSFDKTIWKYHQNRYCSNVLNQEELIVNVISTKTKQLKEKVLFKIKNVIPINYNNLELCYT